MNAPSSLELQWSTDHAIGHGMIDQQHRRLFEPYSLIAEAFAAGLGHAVLDDALTELRNYTREHFRDEEALMARLGYVGLAGHRRAHQRFIRDLEGLASDLHEGQPVLLYELLSLVRGWLTEHILTEDTKLKPLLREW